VKNHILCTLIALLVSGSSAQARNPDITPAPLEASDGITWSGLTLGKTTANDIKKQFKTGRSALPMSQELSQPKEVNQKIFALFSDKHDDSPLAMILLRYSDHGPDLASLRSAVAAPEKDYYQSGRLEDWKLATFPAKGIVAFELTTFGQETIPMVILCPPGSISAVCQGLSAKMRPVVIRNDPHANEPKTMSFGTVTVNTDLKGLELKSGEKQDVERTMIDTTANGTMRYSVGAPGSYVTDVSGSFTPDKGGSLSVTSTISGDGPYGFITVTGSSSQSLPAVKSVADAFSGVNSTDYTVALYEALEKASSSFRDAMLASGPPPIQTVRLQEWQELVEDFRAQKPAASDYSPSITNSPSAEPTFGFGRGLSRYPLSPEAQKRQEQARATRRDDYLKGLNLWVNLDEDQKQQIRAVLENGRSLSLHRYGGFASPEQDDQNRAIWHLLSAPQQAIITRIGSRPPGYGDEYYRWLSNALMLTDDQAASVRQELEKEAAREAARRKYLQQSLASGQSSGFANMRNGTFEHESNEQDKINKILTPPQRLKYDTLQPLKPDFITPLAAQAGVSSH
jgi:hypothetical protein